MSRHQSGTPVWKRRRNARFKRAVGFFRHWGYARIPAARGKALSLDFAALDKLPQRRVQAEAHGHKADCRGANLIDVLTQVGASSGEKLRGKDLALYVRIRAADGYRVVYALAELDPMFRGDNVPVLTHECDGKPLDAKDGPFRIVAPDEKRPARWIRQVTAIDLLRAP